MPYKPPFTFNNQIVTLFGEVSELIGQFKSKNILDVDPKLRRKNQVKSIVSSCAIEGNTLGEDIVTDIINHKRVAGDPREILEIKNAIALYQEKENLNFKNIDDHLHAHKILMDGLIEDAGQFRSAGVGVFQGKKLIHMAPPAKRVAGLVQDLFEWLEKENTMDLIIKSAVFHYEFEFIHPFQDGNGRMGRFWQSLILIEHHPIFRSVPIESIVYEHQQKYYDALQKSQKNVDCAPFVEFSLFTIIKALKKVFDEIDGKNSASDRIKSFIEVFKDKTFTRSDYMKFFKGISSATASKDLRRGVEENLVEKSGDKRTTVYKAL